MSRGLKRLLFGSAVIAIGIVGLIGWFSSPEGTSFAEQQVASASEGRTQRIDVEPTQAYWETFQGQVCTMITSDRPTLDSAWSFIEGLIDQTQPLEHRFKGGGMELWSSIEAADSVAMDDVICGKRKY